MFHYVPWLHREMPSHIAKIKQPVSVVAVQDPLIHFARKRDDLFDGQCIASNNVNIPYCSCCFFRPHLSFLCQHWTIPFAYLCHPSLLNPPRPTTTHTTMLRKPLTNSHNDEIILYDQTAMWEIKSHIADGYVSLLKTDDKELAFFALTQGNVVDACFGISSFAKDRDHKGAAFARKAKGLIDQAADTSEGVKKTAVETYRKAFETLIQTHDKKKKIFFLFRCFFSGGIQKRGQKAIEDAFLPLEEAIQSST